MSSVNPRRSYRSTIRRGGAPQAILDAAGLLFRTKGYLATSVDEIAAEAGVARPTVFAAVGPKPVILKLVVDHAMAGDATPTPVADRPWFREAFDEPSPFESLRLHARNIRLICDRVADLLWAVETAASVDADAAVLWADLQAQRHTAMTNYVRHLAGKSGLRQDADTIVQTMWAMIPAMYLRLVRDRGWSGDRFESWLADAFIRLCLD